LRNVLSEIERYVENNTIWDLQEILYLRGKDKELTYPNKNKLTIHKWNYISLAWNIAKSINEFEYLINEVDIRKVFEYNTYNLLSNLQPYKE
jgi:hypothetical protein